MIAHKSLDSNQCERGRFSSYIKERLRLYFGNDIFHRYFYNLEYAANESELSIRCPNKSSYSAITSQYYDSIQKLLSIIWPGTKIGLAVTNAEAANVSNLPAEDLFASEAKGRDNVVFRNFNDAAYSFESFISDESNELPLFLAKTFSEKKSDLLPDGNMLFLYGDVGHGKTHLARSAHTKMLENDINVAFFTSESFTSGFVNSLRANTLFSFKSEILSKDAIIFDDLHCMVGRTHSFNELCNIVCSMLDNGKRVVMTSVEKPSAFPVKIKSRVMSGVSAAIGRCSDELKMKIVNRMILQKNLPIESPLVDFLVKNINGGIRELKGAVNRLVASVALSGGRMSCDFAKIALADMICEETAAKQSYKNPVDKIKLAASVYFEVPEERMLSKGKGRDEVYARNVAMYLCRKLLKMTYAAIATQFNRSTHNSVVMAISSLEDKLKKEDPATRKAINAVKVMANKV